VMLASEIMKKTSKLFVVVPDLKTFFHIIRPKFLLNLRFKDVIMSSSDHLALIGILLYFSQIIFIVSNLIG